MSEEKEGSQPSKAIRCISFMVWSGRKFHHLILPALVLGVINLLGLLFLVIYVATLGASPTTVEPRTGKLV